MGILLRLIWLVISAVILSYGSYLVIAKQVIAEESGMMRPVEMIDELKPGVHFISGMIMVPNACDELTIHVSKINETTYDLRFNTWEEPSVRCARGSVPRHFTTIAFAPAAGIIFLAELDGTPFPVTMKQRIISERSTSSRDAEQ